MRKLDLLKAHKAGKTGEELVAELVEQGLSETEASEYVDYVLNGGDTQPPLRASKRESPRSRTGRRARAR